MIRLTTKNEQTNLKPQDHGPVVIRPIAIRKAAAAATQRSSAM
jgi:hypothetical protein